MQIIYTLLQTDNHTSTSPVSFYRPDALFAAHATVSRHILEIIDSISETVQDGDIVRIED